ncbi:MAG: phosphotransferase [Pseudomonadales bacterium]|nr:phosphotransferase [Pseudomonadales bacterium]MCP5184582.1 phosphotransferase [Pseudomonadales bacterium]
MMHFDQENGIVIRGLTNRRTTPDVLSHRASTLFADGLRTPPIAVNGDGATLVMPLIPGITGLKHFAALIQATAGWNQLADAQLDLLMKPMVALHRLPAHNLQLDEHQPFARIDARLHARRVRPELLPDLREARELLGRLTAATAQRQHRHATLIHGDYHPSQLILTLPNECPWLLDLEDLARGAPEVDLANLCAYVATNPSLAAGNPAQTLRHLLRRCAARYTALGGTIPRAELLHLHAAVTLLRRALKLEAAGADTASVNGILMLLHDILADQHLTSGAPHVNHG